MRAGGPLQSSFSPPSLISLTPMLGASPDVAQDRCCLTGSTPCKSSSLNRAPHFAQELFAATFTFCFREELLPPLMLPPK